MRCLYQQLCWFFRDTAGNVATAFAFLLPVMLLAAGSGVDYANRVRVVTAAQKAADAAALTAASLKVSQASEADIEAAAHRVFHANLNSTKASGLSVNNTLSATSSGYVYTVDGSLSTLFLKGFRVPELSVDVFAHATMPQAIGAEVAIVIDATNSMSSGNTWDLAMDALSNTLGVLQNNSDRSHFYVTLVPYQDRVNVGNASWLNGALPANWNGCYEPREENSPGFPFSLSDDTPGDDPFAASIPGVTGGLSVNGAPFPYCPNVALTGPVSDPVVIGDVAKNITRGGTGRFDVGLAWGWRALSHDWVNQWGIDDYPATPDETKKILVFITDGHTTAYLDEMSQTQDFGWNNGSVEGFNHLVNVCDQAKADGIEIYVFHIKGNPSADQYFRSCASDVTKYRKIETNDDLINAFSLLIANDQYLYLKE